MYSGVIETRLCMVDDWERVMIFELKSGARHKYISRLNNQNSSNISIINKWARNLTTIEKKFIPKVSCKNKLMNINHKLVHSFKRI